MKKALLLTAAVFLIWGGIAYSSWYYGAGTSVSYEDYTTFTEEVGSGSIDVNNATKITVTAMPRNNDDYLYIDKTANYYSADYEFWVDFKITGSVNNGVCAIIGLANGIDDIYACDPRQGVYAYDTGPGYILRLFREGGTQDSAAVSSGTTYYIRFKRDDDAGTYGTLYLDIFSTAALRIAGGNGDVSDIELACTSTDDLRYLYGTSSWNTGTAGNTMSMEIYNLLQVSP